MSIPYRVTFTYGTPAHSWTPELPPRAWLPDDRTTGGGKVSAAGVPAAYIVRRDVRLQLTLRFSEAEWDEVIALVSYAQQGLSLLWRPEATELEAFEVYLDEPAPGVAWAPSRDTTYPLTLELPIVLRSIDPSVSIWQPYYRGLEV